MTFEIIVVVLVVLILTLAVTAVLRLGVVHLEGYLVKARVFSLIKLTRRVGGIVWIGENGIFLKTGGEVVSFDTDIGVERIFGEVVYRDGRIVRAGTVYGKGWSVSFSPVTGFMRVEVGR